jgi:hypothetical protein
MVATSAKFYRQNYSTTSGHLHRSASRTRALDTPRQTRPDFTHETRPDHPFRLPAPDPSSRSPSTHSSPADMPFAIDNTTLALLGVLAALLLYIRFFALPSPLVHPLLLGKQSDVSAVRRKGETGIYRSFATGQGSPVSLRSPATRHDSDCSSPYDLRAR